MSIATERRTDVRLDQVHHAIRAYCAERTHSASRYGPEFTELWRIATETVLGGKLVRPRLVLAGHAALTEDDGPTPQTVVNAAAAVELLHYAFVLHDDVSGITKACAHQIHFTGLCRVRIHVGTLLLVSVSILASSVPPDLRLV